MYSQSLALLTDLYELTMANGYWKLGMQDREAVFQLSLRKNPFQGGFSVAAGLNSVIQLLQNFHFSESDIAYLKTLEGPSDGRPLFDRDFLGYLANLKFSCDVDAVPEGTVVFANEPLLRIQGPLLQTQILESIILNMINFQSLIATKAARVTIAAAGDPVFEFGMRRAQGIDGALSASRAAYIGGCVGTSNVLAGKMYGIPVKGTHAHSWVMAFDTEMESFQAYAQVMPHNAIFLVDTYSTLQGVKRAIEVGQAMKKQGAKFLGIRLDSGDLVSLSKEARQLLDEAGFHEAQIVASNELDENIIADAKKRGAAIAIWGVGTRLATGHSQSALDVVYKLSALKDASGEWVNKAKLSEKKEKSSHPGILQIKRFSSGKQFVADVLYDVRMAPASTSDWRAINLRDPALQKTLSREMACKDLLEPVFRRGALVYEEPSLEETRAKAKRELEALPEGVKSLEQAENYFVGNEESLHRLMNEIIAGKEAKS